MIKKVLYVALFIFLSVGSILSFLRALDAAIEIDSLKSQIQLQEESLQLLQSITNNALASCGTTVAAFEGIAVRMNGHSVFWEGQIALVGPFRVTKKDSCIERIELIGL